MPIKNKKLIHYDNGDSVYDTIDKNRQNIGVLSGTGILGDITGLHDADKHIKQIAEDNKTKITTMEADTHINTKEIAKIEGNIKSVSLEADKAKQEVLKSVNEINSLKSTISKLGNGISKADTSLKHTIDEQAKIHTELAKIENEINHLSLNGVYLGAFDTVGDIPSSLSPVDGDYTHIGVAGSTISEYRYSKGIWVKGIDLGQLVAGAATKADLKLKADKTAVDMKLDKSVYNHDKTIADNARSATENRMTDMESKNVLNSLGSIIDLNDMSTDGTTKADKSLATVGYIDTVIHNEAVAFLPKIAKKEDTTTVDTKLATKQDTLTKTLTLTFSDGTTLDIKVG